VLRLVVRSAVDVGRPTLYAMLIIIAALVAGIYAAIGRGTHFPALALTYSFALIGALVFALTLVPALCASCSGRGTPSFRSHPGRTAAPRGYRRSLSWLLDRRGGFSPRHLSCRRWRC